MDAPAYTQRIAYPTLDEESVEQLLGLDVSAVLAFVDPQGFPRIVPCWFLWEDGCFCVSSIADKFHVKCLRKNPRASICVEHEDVEPGQRRTNRQAKAVGEVVLSEDPDGAWTQRIRSKYLSATRLDDTSGKALLTPGEQRVIIRLRPTKMSAHGSSLVRRTGKEDG